MSSFILNLSKELPDVDRIDDSSSYLCKPTLVKSTFQWISISMYGHSSQISAPSLALIDTSNYFFKVFLSPNITFFVLWDCSFSMYCGF